MLCNKKIRIILNINKRTNETEEKVMKKRVLSLFLCTTMLAGMLVGCGSKTEDTSSDKTEDGKVVLNVINYHVGTDYAADYYEYLFDAFQKTEEGKNVEFKF